MAAFFSSNKENELRDLYNYLSQKVIKWFSSSNGSVLGDNLIMSLHQVGYMSSPLIPSEAVENKNNQEHLVANKVAR